jgi:hypothetical protein
LQSKEVKPEEASLLIVDDLDDQELTPVQVNPLDLPLPKDVVLPDPIMLTTSKGPTQHTLDELLTQQMTSDKLPGSEETAELGCKSNVLSLPSECEDDLLAFSDIPIMKIDTLRGDQESNNDDQTEYQDQVNLIKGKEKPKGSAYVSCRMSIGDSEQLADVDICIDTGADFTLCDSTFLKVHFGGNEALKHIYHPYRVPNLRSASGHVLQILGKVEVKLLLGEFIMNLAVIVHEGDIGMFLLGSDSFYDKLIFDRGKFLAFADDKHPPIPIKYELVKNLVKAVGEFRVAPRSSVIPPIPTDTCKVLCNR